MKKIIDKIYDKHPIIWQASVFAIIVFIMFLVAWFAWQSSWGS